MANLGDGFKDIFLAGIGAMAITGEKTKDLVEQLIAKGELTVDQGKQINTELRHKVEGVACTMRYDALEARMSMMTPEERAEFAAKAAEFAAKANVKPVEEPEVGAATGVVVEGDAKVTCADAAVPLADEGKGCDTPSTPQAPGA